MNLLMIFLVELGILCTWIFIFDRTYTDHSSSDELYYLLASRRGSIEDTKDQAEKRKTIVLLFKNLILFISHLTSPRDPWTAFAHCPYFCLHHLQQLPTLIVHVSFSLLSPSSSTGAVPPQISTRDLSIQQLQEDLLESQAQYNATYEQVRQLIGSRCTLWTIGTFDTFSKTKRTSKLILLALFWNIFEAELLLDYHLP